MKKQHRIAGIASTLLIAGLFLPQAVLAQQNPSQPAQPPETAQQPQTQDQQPAAQPNSAPASTAPAATQPATDQDQQQQSQQGRPAPGGTTVNPSQGPLQPVQPVTTYPDASGAQQQQPGAATTPAQATTVPEAPQPKKQPSEPVGAAAAESVPTAGGAAAKPAGVAIAPAKQHQTRSLLIKIGAVAAAGAALGAVFALSHSTPSTPPGATTPGAAPR
jgi:Herpesviridae large tegument protein deneddylase